MRHRNLIYISLFLLLPVWSLQAQTVHPVFHSLSSSDGLSQNRISSIVQDSYGFIWFGTNDGLSRYDGHSFKIYGHTAKDGINLSNPRVSQLAIMRNGDIWVGTFEGDINIINIRTGKSELVQLNQGDNPDHITSICEDVEGRVWIGTEQSGLWMFDTLTKQLEHKLGTGVGRLAVPTINQIVSDEAGNLLIATKDHGVHIKYNNRNNFEELPVFGDTSLSVNRLLSQNRKNIWLLTDLGLVHYDLFTGKTKNLLLSNASEDRVFGTILLDGNSLWIGEQWHSGLWHYDIATEESVYYSADNDLNSNLSKSAINVLFRDRDGLIWMGTNGSGVNYFNTRAIFNRIKSDSEWPFMINSTSTRAILQDNQDTSLFWIAGYGALDAYHLQKGNVNYFNAHKSEDKGWEFNTVYSLAHRDANTMYVGTEGRGLYIMDKADGQLQQVPDDMSSSKVSRDIITSLYRDSKDRIWVGTNHGLKYIDSESAVLKNYSQSFSDTERIAVSDIIELPDGNILIATDGGLFMINRITNSMNKCALINGETKIENISLHSFLLTENGNLYIATNGKGLYSVDFDIPVDVKLPVFETKIITTKDGLPNNVVYRVHEDKRGNIWGSTNQGIFKYDPVSQEVYNFDLGNGLASLEYNKNSSTVTEGGLMFFGGITGVTWFDPMSVDENRKSPKVVFTSLTIDSVEIPFSSFQTTDSKLTISPKQYALYVNFSSFCYSNPEFSQYTYRLLGGAGDWTSIGNSSQLILTGLPPGEYTLEVKGADNLGRWSAEPARMDFEIEASFIESIWFKGLLLLLLIALIVGLYFYRITSVRNRNRMLKQVVLARTRELMNQKQQLEKSLSMIEDQNFKLNLQKNELGNLSALKDKVLSIVSHDVRSPLTGFKGFLKLVMMGAVTHAEMTHLAGDLHGKVEQTLILLDNLLKWAQGEYGELKPVPKYIELRQLTEETIALLKLNAQQKEIVLVNQIADKTHVYADSDMVSLVLRNLIANAIKFTHISGNIVVKSEKEKNDHIRVSVIDDGVGMTTEQAYQLINSTTKQSTEGTDKEKGIGLGLQLCKEFIANNGGELNVTSELGKGSNFSFTLPMSKEIADTKVEVNVD